MRKLKNSRPVETTVLIAEASSTLYPTYDAAQVRGQFIPMVNAKSWGGLPALSLVGACGLLLIAGANALSRSGVYWAESLFWAGLLTVVVPFTIRLASPDALRKERIGLVVIVGLMLYLVKVIHSPFGFTFADELVHTYNTLGILRIDALFRENPILGVTPLYPGLETATAALVSLTGLSTFGAGLLVVGMARLLLTLALFLFYERVSDSSRSAGLATLLYMANPNFLYFSAQFSYESIALPLMALVLFAVTRRESAYDRLHRFGFTLSIMFLMVTVVMIHHMTSYFLTAFLLGWATIPILISRLVVPFMQKMVSRSGDQTASRPWRGQIWTNLNKNVDAYSGQGPGGLAVFALVATVAWLILIASPTTSYLSPVLIRAIVSIFNMIAGEESARQLFQSNSGYIAPLWERIAGLSSVFLCLLGLPFGLRIVWRRHVNKLIALILTGAALAYFGMLGLRFTHEAWETGNRASEFLYIGLAFVVALGGIELWQVRRMRFPIRMIITASVSIIFMGGVIAGWLPQLRLSQPYRVAVGNQVIESQGLAAAKWSQIYLGKGNIIGSDISNAQLMLVHGEQHAYAGRWPDIEDILETADMPEWQIQILQNWQIRYFVVDRRLVSQNNMAGLYFDWTGGGRVSNAELYPAVISEKFDKQPKASRVFDSGNIAIYDVSELRNVSRFR